MGITRVFRARPNRRLTQRRLTGVTVFVSDGSEMKQCTLRDISVGGAFIETRNFALAEGTKLDLVFMIRREGEPIACGLPAKVVRVEEDGMALMFGSLDEHLYSLLLKIVTRPGNREVTSQS